MKRKDSTPKKYSYVADNKLALPVVVLNDLQQCLQSIVLGASLFLFPTMAFSESADMSTDINLPATIKKIEQLPADFQFDLLHYDKERYLLAYNVFLMNGRSDLAYDLAKSAVQQKPDSILWREKLIKVSLWTNHSQKALEQYFYLIENNKDTGLYFEKALKLAKQIRNFDTMALLIAKRLKQDPNNKKWLLEYSLALQNQGYPEQALAFIQKIPQAEKDKDYLMELANIAKNMDMPSLQKHYLQRLWQEKKESTSKESTVVGLALAELLYAEGDVAGAYQIYKVLATFPENTIDFWHKYAEISSFENENASAIYAYKKLSEKKAIDTLEFMQMIDLEIYNGQKEQAYRDAMAAYKEEGKDFLVPEILNLGVALNNKWDALADFIAKLPKNVLSTLKNNPDNFLSLLTVKVHLGLFTQVRQAWIDFFNKWPHSSLGQGTYLWYLIDNYDIRQLEYTLGHWSTIFDTKPELWVQYVAASTAVGDYRDALAIALRHRKEAEKSYKALIDISTLLQNNNFDYESYYVGQKAFYLLRKEINKKLAAPDIEQTLLLSELLQLFSSSSLAYQVLVSQHSQVLIDPRVDEQVMSFALKSQAYSLANYISNTHKLKKSYIPPWMSLTLALVYEDREVMQALLRDSAKILPYRDRVQAATRTGNLKLAQDYAYQGLKEHPFDNEMYSLFQGTMLDRSNRFSLGGALFTPGDVSGPYTHASARLWLTPSLVMHAYARLWTPTINQPSIGWAPLQQKTGISLRKDIQKGWVQGNIAENSGMQAFMTAKLKFERRLSSKTIMNLAFNYQETATETTALMLAGMKNAINLNINTKIDNYNYADVKLSVNEFLAQDRTFLGYGQTVALHWQNKFLLAYPDWNINAYANWNNYSNKIRPVSQRLQRFAPPIDQNLELTIENIGSDFFMPVSYKEVALTFGFGQEYRQEYTHTWKPFAELGVLYAMPFGLGPLVDLGIAGSVFGRDHLALFTEYSMNQQQASQKFYTIGMRYDNYF